MSPVAALSSAFRHYATFSGRARRAEYWWFTLIRAMAFLGISFGIWANEPPPGAPDGPMLNALVLAFLLLALGTLLPDLAVTIRRLHDAGLSGFWLLVVLVPVLGALTLFICTVLPGDKGYNRFGRDPRQVRSVPATTAEVPAAV